MLAYAALMSCGGMQNGETATSDDTTPNQTLVGNPITVTPPINSTDTEAEVSLAIGSDSTVSQSLKLVADAAMGEVELTAAKFNIAAIKIKTEKEPSAEEVAAEKEQLETEKSDVEEVEKVENGEDVAIALIDNGKNGEKKGKEKKQEKRDNVAKKKEKLAEKEAKMIAKMKESDASTKFSGPYLYDAIAGTLESDVENTTLVDGNYKRVEFKLRRNFSAADDDPILGQVFYIHGNYTKDGVTTPFEIDYHVAMNFRLPADQDLVITPGESNSLAIVFKVKDWFKDIDLSAAEVNEDGTIYVNKTENNAILKAIRKNIKKSVSFGKDKDGDGKLSSSEKSGEGEEDTGDEIDEDA